MSSNIPIATSIIPVIVATMGLYCSEYWTYLLPTRVGPGRALELTEHPLPIGMKKAKAIGLIDAILPDNFTEFQSQVRLQAEALAGSPDYDRRLRAKRELRAVDEDTGGHPLESLGGQRRVANHG